jgi:hypothetical protein
LEEGLPPIYRAKQTCYCGRRRNANAAKWYALEAFRKRIYGFEAGAENESHFPLMLMVLTQVRVNFHR